MQLIERMMGNFRNHVKTREIPITVKNTEKPVKTECTCNERGKHDDVESHSCRCKSPINGILRDADRYPERKIVMEGDNFHILNKCDIYDCTFERGAGSNDKILTLIFNVRDEDDIMEVVSDLIDGKTPDIHFLDKNYKVIHSDYFTSVLSFKYNSCIGALTIVLKLA